MSLCLLEISPSLSLSLSLSPFLCLKLSGVVKEREGTNYYKLLTCSKRIESGDFFNKSEAH